jgi:hypothetical protein
MPEPTRQPDPNQGTGTPQLGRFNRDTSGMKSPFDNSFTTQRSLRYPSDLNGNEYPHWIAFYPLIREGTADASRVSRRRGAKIFDVSGQNRSNADNAAAAGAAQGAVLGAQTAGVAALGNLKEIMGAKGGKSTLQAAGAAVGKWGVITGLATAGGAAAGGLLNGIGARGLIFGAQSVVLGVHDRLSFGYAANYDTADLGGIVGAVAAGKVSGENLLAGGTELAEMGARKLAKLAGAIGGDAVSNLKEATSKKVENPYKEQLFKNMGFRKFGFEYKFAPRTRAEAEEIFGRSGIISTFLHHMHPEQSQGGMFLIYPSEFLIVIYYKGEENKYVRKISNCALTNMTVEYGGDGFTTFQDTKGMPTEATMRLEFTELETLTNNRIDAGY